MTTGINKLLVVLAVGSLVCPQSSDAFGWNWFWPRTTTTTTASTSGTSSSNSNSQSVASVYNISIGNRVNTNTSTIDYGTSITNLQINLARFNGTAWITSNASEDRLNELIYGVAEQFRNAAIAVVDQRLAWIDETIEDALLFGELIRSNEETNWLKMFPEQVRASVGELNETVHGCLERSLNIEELIQSVTNRSRSGCIDNVFVRLRDARNKARNSLKEFLTAAEDIEDTVERCIDLQDDFDDEMSDLYKEACISSVLLGMEIESLRLDHTVRQRTPDLEPLLYQSKASLLECTADLTAYAFNASLAFRQWINTCSSARKEP